MYIHCHRKSCIVSLFWKIQVSLFLKHLRYRNITRTSFFCNWNNLWTERNQYVAMRAKGWPYGDYVGPGSNRLNISITQSYDSQFVPSFGLGLWYSRFIGLVYHRDGWGELFDWKLLCQLKENGVVIWRVSLSY